ncbi:AP2-like DNA-binding integrase domain-containing protein [Fontibacillus panacisegetis]|uniref:AP2-like DNA-binding integrase domain-containing protein n=1 Tax=Fontibacillus panacisegetis TaxID=670482 RepID=A0A1G7HYQ8_9BACL|nr:phage integrase SAM-like domain-containing protein [Fontibacillus panacisegetis]SDF05612.1 AP2-like DNA-binding integrase domain-containing protein [Fontibacillus panacisegetis]
MPVYRDETKKKNQFWYEFEAGKKLDGSRRKIRKKGFLTEKEATVAMTKAMNDFFEGTYVEPSKIKFIDYLNDTWLPAKKSLSQQTREMYNSYINRHVKTSSCGNIELGKLNPTHMQKLIVELREKGLAENTVKKIYSIVNTALNNATYQLRLIKENPALYVIDKPQNVKTEILVWDAEESRKFVKESE